MTSTLNILANNYINGKHCITTFKEESFLKAWILGQYQSLPVDVVVTCDDVSPEQMLSHYQEHNELLISSAGSEHPILSQADNVRFRAVHDWHHISQGFGFDLDGEIAAARYAISLAPKAIHWMLWSEIALQAAACIKTGEFQPQKLVHCYL